VELLTVVFRQHAEQSDSLR